MESVGREEVTGVRSRWCVPRALGVVWVIEEKIAALCGVWFSFWLQGRAVVAGIAVKRDKKISKKEKGVACLDRILDPGWQDKILADLLA